MSSDPTSRPLSPSRRDLLQGLAAVTALAAGGRTAAATPAGPLAPDFTLRSVDGRNLRLHEQRGQVVLVNFWATWCGPCRIEMPHLNRLYDKYRDAGFVLLGVNVDDDPRSAAAAATKLGLRFPVLPDADKTVSRLYDLSAMPSTVLIDRDGRVRHVHRGYKDGYELTYDAQIRELLK
jgi:peroxiredoxin